MKNKQIFGLILAIFLLSFVSASYNFTNSSIQTQYSKNSAISGNLEISFKNEPITNFFSDSLGNKVLLRELLSNSPSYIHTCSYTGCESKFKQTGSNTAYSLLLNEGESAFYGFVFNENLVKINSVEFELESDAGQSPTSQIYLDILNDGTSDFKNEKVGTTVSQNTTYGCYIPSTETEVMLTTTPYCQEISLEEAPGLQIGAWVKEILSGNLNVTMKLFDKNGEFIDSCNLFKNDLSSIGSKVFCDVDSYIQKDNYYVCLSRSSLGEGEYKIHGHNQATNCGFIGIPIQNQVYTYEIGAKEKYYGNVGTITINDSLQNGESFSENVENYIVSTYGGLDCSKNKCYVPIKISSYKNQTITIKNLKVDYDFSGGKKTLLTTFSELAEDPSQVNSSKGILSLGQFFKFQNKEGNLTYSLSYMGKKLLDKKISIKDYNINLYPTKLPVLFNTEISAYIPSELNPSLYTWDFGDGQTASTKTPTVKHSYTTEGTYTLNLLISTKIGDLSKSFQIEVSSAKDVLNSELQKRKDILVEVEKSISSLSSFEESQMKKLIDITTLKTNLSDLEKEQELAASDSDYNKIVAEFLTLKFPSSIQKSEVSRSFVNPSSSKINLNALEAATGNNYTDSTGTYDYIQFWDVDNLNSMISQNKISVIWEDGTTSQLNVYGLSIIPSKSIEEDYYLLIKDQGDLTFSDNSKIKEADGYKYVLLVNKKEDFTFSTIGEVQVGNDLFISPSKVVVSEIGSISEFKAKTWIIYLGIIAVLLIGLSIYFIMHKWYKLKYEKFLFPDKNQLYNAIVYISNLVKKDVEESEIRSNLLKAGWKREQVTYLLKKYAGKRTGMIDLFGFLKPKKYIDMSTPPNPGRNTEFRSFQDTKFNK